MYLKKSGFICLNVYINLPYLCSYYVYAFVSFPHVVM